MTKRRIEIFQYKAFINSLHSMHVAGGDKRRHAGKVHALLGRLHLGLDAFTELPVTHHGESRIKHCVKYNIGDGYRLITVQNDRMIGLLFVGSHDDADRWLESNSGLTVSRGSSGAWEPIFQSTSVDEPIRRAPVGGHTQLIERLNKERVNELLQGVPATTMMRLIALGPTASSMDIEDACAGIPDASRRTLANDVFSLLASGDRAAAESRLDLELGAAREFDDLTDADILEVQDGDSLRRLRVGSPQFEDWLRVFSRKATSLEWLLFLHPEQSTVVNKDFDGPAQLSGVSGSGKTCVAIHRALRLALTDADSRVLIVTLNRALAGLISSLVDAAAPSEGVRAQISVKSFFQVCQEQLSRFEPDNSKLYCDITWKLNEHIDEVFREYYRCWTNNRAAEELLPIHHSLIAQSICAETYVKEEFDWIRSALPVGEREEYLQMDRLGRKIPLQHDWRLRLLSGLSHWELKMREVGVIDYLGLTAAVTKYVDRLAPDYDHILIDEAQDFGTSELRILRALCAQGPNDLFLCGDIAQHVLPKHRSLSGAGVITTNRTCRIVRNYRNSREILEAAYAILMENLDEHLLDSSDLEILDPKFASRSSNQPVVLRARSLEHELGFARSLAAEHLAANPNHRCCIAIAGYSIREVGALAAKINVPVLVGEKGPIHESLVLSDLEQTKGYEFNLVVIVNCREGILPPAGTAAEEAFRHGCRLYVAMTRARDELVLSFSGESAAWLRKVERLLHFMNWEDVVALDSSLVCNPPEKLRETEGDSAKILALHGREFLYSPAARGLSLEAIRKIDELVDGQGLIRGKTRVKWRNMTTLLEDLKKSSKAQQTFGSVVHKEVRDRLESISH